jgi:hypothetical protein
MRDQLVALEIRGRTRIDKAQFDVRMLTMNDFEIGALANNSREISSACTVMWDVQMQRDLAALCTSKAELCLHIGEISQSLVQSQDGSDWPKDAKHSYDGLTKWLENLPIPCQYQAPTATVVQNGRSCIFVHRALLHMLYFAVDSAIREQYFLQKAEVAAQTSIYGPAKRSLDASLRLAADQITGIAKDLTGLKLEQYLPSSGVTVLFYASNIHVLDIKSSDDVMRKRAVLGFGKCMAAMESLRAIYTSADNACRLLGMSKRQDHSGAAKTKSSNFIGGKRHGNSLSVSELDGNIASQFYPHHIKRTQPHAETPTYDKSYTKSGSAKQQQETVRGMRLENSQANQSRQESPSVNNNVNALGIAQQDIDELPDYEDVLSISELDTLLDLKPYMERDD